MPSVNYSLFFRNQSTRGGSVCVFQTDSEIEAAGARPVAWMVKAVAPTTALILSWSAEYAFVWRETNMLSDRAEVRASQSWPVDFPNRSQVTLRRDASAYTFADEREAPSAGTIVILTDPSVVPAELMVGIGMAEMPTFIMPAEPGATLAFAPKPSYWITFGDFTAGQALEPQQVASASRLLFPHSVTALIAVLRDDNTWSISPA